MKNETQSALVARDAAIILLLIWAFMQALLMIWAPADTQTTYLLLLFLMDIAVLCGFMDRVNTGTALAATITCGWPRPRLPAVSITAPPLWMRCGAKARSWG